MTTRISIPLKDSYKLFNHGPVSIITSAHGNKRNVMAASWTMPVDFSPAKVAVVIDNNTYTRELVDASGEFGLQFPMRKIAKLTLDVGDISGRDNDKFSRFGINTFSAEKIAAPFIEDCIGWLECKVIRQGAETMDVIIGEVIAAYADAEQFIDGRWHFSSDPQKRSIHYMAGGEFYMTGEAFRVESGHSAE
ncbi:flavin reductase family protein [Cellvibrio sp. pealriver]|uniref:flavin reductase family protein n=1 Tax=Cellvibrio sp. pealriver TaxID=1622269 RepID=UPI00066FDC15|nr:flavin reductase family protein [Cellvibrio sp. pealriver]